MKVLLTLRVGEVDALADALELADACISQSEYGDNRDQAAREKNAVRTAWKVYTRLAEAELQSVKQGCEL